MSDEKTFYVYYCDQCGKIIDEDDEFGNVGQPPTPQDAPAFDFCNVACATVFGEKLGRGERP